MRNIGDRSYDKRKVVALEVEKYMRRLQGEGKKEQIAAVIRQLAKETCSINSNHCKGGLHALAGSAIGLMDDTKVLFAHSIWQRVVLCRSLLFSRSLCCCAVCDPNQEYLDLLVPAVLKCFAHTDARVRYYACESMFNIVKVARGHILRFFNVVFIGLCKLFADLDVDIKNAAVFLDRLLKDIVTESESFDIDRFIPLLQDQMRGNNPYVLAGRCSVPYVCVCRCAASLTTASLLGACSVPGM